MSLLNELKRRNVLRVGAAYVVMAWLIIQVVETIFPLYGLSDGAIRLVITLLAIGLIPVVILAWAFEITPEGLKKDKDVDRSQPVTLQTGKKLDRMIMVVLALALGYFAFDKFVLDPAEDVQIAQSAHQQGRSAAFNESFGDKSIAVMPFINLSEESSNQFFADGIHDDLLTRISNIRDIKTISRSSVMTYRNSDKSSKSIAKELRVSTILEGGVQRAGDQVRINLKLIDAESDAHLWARSFTRELTATNVFAVQAEISEAVAGALKVILSAAERSQLGKQPTSNLQALDAYYLGNQLFDQATSSGVAQAILAYQAAIRLDSEFALAYSQQASAMLTQVYIGGMPVKTQLEKSRPLIDQAILLDPQSSEAFTALGNWYRRSKDFDMAFQAYEKAMALRPNNAYALANYGNLLWSERSDPDAAIKLFKRAVELDPQNINLKRRLARALPTVGQVNESIVLMEGIVAEHPDSAPAYRDLAMLYSNEEFRYDKGVRVMRKAFELDPDHPANSYLNAILHWTLGDYDNTALWMNHSARLVPDPIAAGVYRGWAFIAQENFENARLEFEHLDADYTLYWLGIFYLGSIDAAEDRLDDAIGRYQKYAAKFDEKRSNSNFFFGIGLINAYQALGEKEKAQGLIDELISIIEANPSVTYHDSAILDASVYTLSGKTEVAISILEEWVNRGGATSLLQQDIRHGLGVLADDPRYQSIMRTVNQRLSEQKDNLARWEASGEMPPIPIEVSNSQ